MKDFIDPQLGAIALVIILFAIGALCRWLGIGVNANISQRHKFRRAQER